MYCFHYFFKIVHIKSSAYNRGNRVVKRNLNEISLIRKKTIKLKKQEKKQDFFQY